MKPVLFMKNGLFNKDGKWCYRAGHASGKGFDNKEAAARAYAKAFINQHPKYQPLVAGKPWPEIYRILGIRL